MGQVVAVAAAVSVVAHAAAALLQSITHLVSTLSKPGNIGPNPVMESLEAHAAEERQREQERLQRELDAAERSRQEAEERQREADQQRRRAEEEAQLAAEERRRAEEEARHAEEERIRAEQARREAEEEQHRSNEARSEAERNRQEAEDASRLAEEARKEAEQQQKQEERRRQEAERVAAAAMQATDEARAAQEAAERKLREGVRPTIWPTEAEIRDTKKRLNYTPGMLHFAVAGISGSGKSSLINALRGIPNGHRNAARVGVTETTMTITPYSDPDPQKPFRWYDIPGAGTLAIPEWQYFNDQGLYIFDSIIILFDNRFTATDVALLRNAQLFNIPTYIVRSKSEQHIMNQATDLEASKDEDEKAQYARARELYVTSTRESVADNLRQAELPPQKVYVIEAKSVLCNIVRGKKTSGDIIDELDFMIALLQDVHDRRVKPAVTLKETTGGSTLGNLAHAATNAVQTAYQAAVGGKEKSHAEESEWDIVSGGTDV